MKRPKIAFLIPGFGVIERGAENIVYELSLRLSQYYDITIFGRGRKKIKSGQGIHQIQVKCIDRDNRVTNWIYHLNPQLTRLLEIVQLSPQSIEMLTFTLLLVPRLLFSDFNLLFPVSGFWGALFCNFLRVIKKVPFVYAAHGGEEPLIARQKPDIYIATTLFTFHWLKKFDLGLQVEYIPNGVDIKKYTPSGKKLNLKLERPFFLTVSAFIPAKRIELAIKAVALLKRGSLLVIGFGQQEKFLAHMGENLLGKERFMLIHAVFPELAEYYRSCDVFTLPSDRDPSPIVFLEAAACNLPLVVPDDERRKSTLKQTALYCDVENTAEYARTLENAAKKNWKNIPRTLAEEYSWDKIAENYHAVIKKLLGWSPQILPEEGIHKCFH